MDVEVIYTSTVAAVPLAFGLLTRLTNAFFERPQDFRNRLALLEKYLVESLSQRLDELLDRFRLALGTDELMRGSRIQSKNTDEKHSSDSIYTFILELYKTMRIVRVVEEIKSIVLFGQWVLLMTSLLGIILVIVIWSIQDYFVTFKLLSVIILSVQIVVVIIIFFQVNRLRHYESFR